MTQCHVSIVLVHVTEDGATRQQIGTIDYDPVIDTFESVVADTVKVLRDSADYLESLDAGAT